MTLHEAQQSHFDARGAYAEACASMNAARRQLADADAQAARGGAMRQHGMELRARSLHAGADADQLKAEGDAAVSEGCRLRDEALAAKQAASQLLADATRARERAAHQLAEANRAIMTALEGLGT